MENGVDAAKQGLRALVEHPDKGGQLAWRVLKESLVYALNLVPEIADDIVKVDEAMRTGFGRKYGPFEMLDQLGVDWFTDKLKEEGIAIPALLEKAAGSCADGVSSVLVVFSINAYLYLDKI